MATNKRRQAAAQLKLPGTQLERHKTHLAPILLFVIISSYFLPTTITNHYEPVKYAHAHAQAQPQQVLVSPNFLQPYFNKSMDLHHVRENTPVRDIIYTLEAKVEPPYPGVQMNYDIEGTQLFAVDQITGQVRVAQPIDREQTGDSISFQVIATPYLMNRPGTQTKLTITVYILDENDNPPRIDRVKAGRQDYDAQALALLASRSSNSAGHSNPFVSSPYLKAPPPVPVIRMNISEETPADSVVVDLIAATDVDKASSNPLSAICLDCEPEFKLVPRTANMLNDRLDWSLMLVNPLVHVPNQNLRQLHVLVSDGKFNTSLVFEITIDDIQNRPPHFISSTTCAVYENTPIDKTILTIQAVDGDAIALDDGPMMVMLSSSASGRKSASQYSGRQIVYDFVDPSGQSWSRREDFKLHPLTGQLQVANRLDRESYLGLNGVISLQVRARELTVDAETVVAGDDLYESILSKLNSFIDQSSESITVSDLTIILLDVNDNSPRWLNASEIVALNRSPVWHDNLPTDRDTGRNYHLRVRENSPAGSPITGKNEIFVYDLDNGENAEFNITLDDPFGLFDVEPKQVNGFSSVTIKLSAPPIGQKQALPVRMLDYENINERSYIIELYATETRTNEHLRSKAQIQINVVDVNDNAPEFKEPAYVANIREDAPAGKLVKLIQATDKDEISKQLTYSLHGQSAYLFAINPSSGAVTVAKCDQQSQSGSTPMMRSTSTRTNSMQQQHLASNKPCIDYETQRLHHLMVEVSDGELSSKVPLTIWIEDVSDNGPVFTLPIVDVVIEEGSERLDPPIKIEATDVDQTSTLSYSIVEGNFEGLFSINNATGELQLTRPIRIAHDDLSGSSFDRMDLRQQQQLNKMTLIVQASDGEHTTNGTIRIDILDANDNAPTFSRGSYEKEITEAYVPGQSVLTVRAYDSDRGNNARVSYRIERGSHSQFDINETSGELTVAQQARPFDASKRDNYTIEVVAYDHGLVSKGSSVWVLIKVLSTSKRAPEFEPQIQRETINESTLNNTIIHRMQINVSQHQQQQQPGQPMALWFEPGPIEGLDKYGQPVVEIERLESMFSVATHTGDVVVNSGLNHDFAAYVNLTIFVSYRPISNSGSGGGSSNGGGLSLDSGIGGSGIGQFMAMTGASNGSLGAQNQLIEEYTPRSVGYLIINVVDDNDNAPVFAAPWTPSQPELSFQMLEELPVGSILTQLVASDADSKISHFEIEPPNEYFELSSPQSGLIVNKKTIDYDSLMRQTFLTPGAHRPSSTSASPGNGQMAQLQAAPGSLNNIIQFNVIVYDSGLKQLSAKAIVSVEILPLNDNDCKFESSVYEVHLRENALVDTVVSQVRAYDLDYGEQHDSISYQLIGEHRDFFNIDSRTGAITVSARGSVALDREQLAQPVIILTVVGRNEQQPLASAAAGEGGLYRTSSLSNKMKQVPAGQAIGARSCSATLKIHVDDVNDNPALFSQKLYEVTAYDTDAIDVPLVKLLVHDEDLKHNNNNNNNSSSGAKLANQAGSGQANTFRIMSGNVNDSFNITQNGMIYVTKPLNESMKSMKDQTIELRVQVRQSSVLAPLSNGGGGGGGGVNQPMTQFTDECLVRVHFTKINRYAPEWRLDSLKAVSIEENSKPGTLIAQLKCIDRDLLETGRNWPLRHRVGHFDQLEAPGDGDSSESSKLMAHASSSTSSPIRYWIKENGSNVMETNEFKLDSVSGLLTSRVELDRESRQFYQLMVSCEDNGQPQSLESITPLYVTVLDTDDNKPEFVVPKSQQQPQQAQLSADLGSADMFVDAGSNHHLSQIMRNRQLVRGADKVKSIQFVVDEHQSKGLQVGELKAIDRDLESSNPILYCLLEGNEFQEFMLDQPTGILYTNKTLDREKQATYQLLVKAINDGSSCEDHQQLLLSRANTSTNSTLKTGLDSPSESLSSYFRVRIDVQDINDNAPIFKRPAYRAGVHHRALINSLVTQVAAFDPDHELNGTLSYRISETLLYKTNPSSSASSQGRTKPSSSSGSNNNYNWSDQSTGEQPALSKPIKLIQSPFRIDQAGNIYTQQLLTQYQLMSMFVLHIEASEQADPWRSATTKLEIYVYETNSQLKIRINLHPKFIELYRYELESMFSNATKYKAIINRSRSYYGNAADSIIGPIKPSYGSSGLLKLNQKTSLLPTLDLSQHSNQVPSAGYSSILDNNEPNFSNIHAIFIDNQRIVNPNVVMEKFDLTSAQLLFTPQSLASAGLADLTGVSQSTDTGASSVPPTTIRYTGDDVSPLIDKIALASIQAAEFHASPSSLAGIDWLESPSILYVCLTAILVMAGFIICMIGCCCTSRIKDHIIKVAMDKLVRQQALQAKINERVLAATNKAYANSTLGTGYTTNDLLANHDYLLQQNGGGLMSSFDATKSCINNNYENISIMQRAMEAGEFIDPNYTTLSPPNGQHMNLGAHYYDASELEQQQQDIDQTMNDDYPDGHHQDVQAPGGVQLGKRIDGSSSVASMSLGEADQDELDHEQELPIIAGAATTNGDLKQAKKQANKLYSNGVNGLVSSHQSRQRQQIPANDHHLRNQHHHLDL